VLGLVSSVLCQEIGWEEYLRNNLLCVEWDVNLNTINQFILFLTCLMVTGILYLH